MAASSFASIGGFRTHYHHAGSGPVLLMLHGQLPGSDAAVEFGGMIDTFAEAGFAVFAPDLAGFGLTDNPADYAIEARIAHVRAFIDFIGSERVAIWGSSMGTYIGAQLALEDRRIDRLVVQPSSVLPPPATQPAPSASPNVGALVHQYTPSLENARALLTLVLANPAALTDDLVQRFFEASSGKNVEAERQRRLAPRPKPLHGELHRLAIPSLLLWGMNDPASTPERALLLMAGMPRAELHLLHRCGHWPQRDQPARTRHLVNDFLRAPV